MKRAIAIILSVLCANAPAYELAMTAQESTSCEREGGCVVISREFMRRLVMQAHSAGMATCESKL